MAQGDKISFYEKKPNNEYKYHTLLIESQIISCHYEPITKHVLISTRPSEKHPNLRHLVFEVMRHSTPGTESEIHLNLILTYKGSNQQKLMARSKMFTINTELYGCSSCEEHRAASVWSVSSGKECARLANTSAVIDVLPLKFRQDSFICSLTEKQLKIFRQRLN